MEKDQLIDTIIRFLEEKGIGVKEQILPSTTFLPGLDIIYGEVVIDRKQLIHPGDILHEAGHIATTTAEDRLKMQGDLSVSMNTGIGEDIAAILWSYAAVYAMQLPASIVFHDDGYKGQSDWYIENFESGSYIGLPLLEWMGMCYGIEKAKDNGQDAYPAMTQWMRS